MIKKVTTQRMVELGIVQKYVTALNNLDVGDIFTHVFDDQLFEIVSKPVEDPDNRLHLNYQAKLFSQSDSKDPINFTVGWSTNVVWYERSEQPH